MGNIKSHSEYAASNDNQKGAAAGNSGQKGAKSSLKDRLLQFSPKGAEPYIRFYKKVQGLKDKIRNCESLSAVCEIFPVLPVTDKDTPAMTLSQIHQVLSNEFPVEKLPLTYIFITEEIPIELNQEQFATTLTLTSAVVGKPTSSITILNKDFTIELKSFNYEIKLSATQARKIRVSTQATLDCNLFLKENPDTIFRCRLIIQGEKDMKLECLSSDSIIINTEMPLAHLQQYCTDFSVSTFASRLKTSPQTTVVIKANSTFEKRDIWLPTCASLNLSSDEPILVNIEGELFIIESMVQLQESITHASGKSTQNDNLLQIFVYQKEFACKIMESSTQLFAPSYAQLGKINDQIGELYGLVKGRRHLSSFYEPDSQGVLRNDKRNKTIVLFESDSFNFNKLRFSRMTLHSVFFPDYIQSFELSFNPPVWNYELGSLINLQLSTAGPTDSPTMPQFEGNLPDVLVPYYPISSVTLGNVLAGYRALLDNDELQKFLQATFSRKISATLIVSNLHLHVNFSLSYVKDVGYVNGILDLDLRTRSGELKLYARNANVQWRGAIEQVTALALRNGLTKMLCSKRVAVQLTDVVIIT